MDIIFPWELDDDVLESARRGATADDEGVASEAHEPDERDGGDDTTERVVDEAELRIVAKRLATSVEDTTEEVAVGIRAFAVATGKSPFDIYEAVEGTRPSVSPLDFVSTGDDDA